MYCAHCSRFASVVHHKVEHHGDEALFYDWDNLESVCRGCHERIHRRGATRQGDAA